MTDNVTISVVAGSAVVISAICVLGGAIFAFLTSNRRIDDIIQSIVRLENRMNAGFDAVNGKLSALDTEVAKLMDRPR